MGITIPLKVIRGDDENEREVERRFEFDDRTLELLEVRDENDASTADWTEEESSRAWDQARDALNDEDSQYEAAREDALQREWFI